MRKAPLTTPNSVGESEDSSALDGTDRLRLLVTVVALLLALTR